MATEVASLFATLRLNNRDFESGMQSARSDLRGARADMQGVQTAARNIGGGLTAGVTAPLLAAGGAAVALGVNFDRSMTNAQAILGLTTSEAAGLRAEVLALGRGSVAGPQAVADAYYQIVSGVQGADAQMAILRSSIALSEAGQADLTATTTGLISIMNAYGLEASQAGYVSDVLARTVGMGVGSMDQFAGALGPASALANDLGIGIDELAVATAFMTSQGDSASESVTQLQAAMTAFLNPNATMKAALEELGYESGRAAIDSLGLAGALQAVNGVTGGLDGNMAAALGSTEALGAAIALNSDRATAFEADFRAGMEGATEAARAIQLESVSAQFALLRSNVQAVGIVVAGVLLPPLVALTNAITPMIERVAEANPEVIQMGVAVLAAAAAIGPLILVLGALLNPVGLAMAAGVALTAAYMTNFGGFRDFIDGPFRSSMVGIGTFLVGFWNNLLTVVQGVSSGIMAAVNGVVSAINAAKNAIDGYRSAGESIGVIGSGIRSGDITPGMLAGGIRRGLADSFRAGGGPVEAGQPYMVGEQGPEMFVPGSNGTVVPNEGGGMGNVSINLNVTEGSARQAGMNFAEGLQERLRARS
jgi:TP901 family phage tail tape measure protein